MKALQTAELRCSLSVRRATFTTGYYEHYMMGWIIIATNSTKG